MLLRPIQTFLSLAICCWASVTSAASSPPNVIVFLADDAGWGDYSRNGNTQISTPNIDSIAKSGVTLDRFYVCPVCAPTRGEFLTGRYHPRTGVKGVSTGQERLDLDEKTVADAFKQAGYATGAFGKWHNGSQWPYHPMARGFDEYYGHSSGHWGEYFDPPLEHNGKMVREKGYIVDLCTDKALDFISRNKAKPFFCFIPFTTPHSPWAATKETWDRLKNKPITQKATESNKEIDDETRCALAMVENQDWNVGRVLTQLKETGLCENTIVLYFSDNGPNSHRWTGGMKGKKSNTDEGGVRSTFFISWPAQLPKGETVTQISAAIDLLPTLTSLAGIPRVGDKPLDGRDLSAQLRDPNITLPERMIFSTWAGKASVRTQTHRLDHEGQLYNMVTDPGQTTIITEQEPALTEKLRQAVAAWRKEVTGGSAKQAPGAKKKGSLTVDPRPIPVGYREFPITMLPARDGSPIGEVQRSSAAPNCSYFVNWTRLEDRLEWLLKVNETGRYEVTIDYTCPEQDTGSVVQLGFKDHSLVGKVTPGWNPPLYDNQDTLPRPKGESRMKEFRTLKLGDIHLTAGEGALVLQALEIPGKSVMDVRRVTLTLLEP